MRARWEIHSLGVMHSGYVDVDDELDEDGIQSVLQEAMVDYIEGCLNGFDEMVMVMRMMQ